jgi:heme-degrading monooxygenase HmoA
MFIKWIVCEVKKGKKQEFSLAQEKWIKSTGADGFIAQAGGWNLKNKYEACIISFWNSKEQLEHFMDNLHDKIFDKNKQSETYNSITVNHFIGKLDMEGEAASILDAIQIATLLRVADCCLKPEKNAHFENVQKEIWIPGMKNSEGMLRGIFSKAVKNNARYLVSTFWNSLENHSYYVDNRLPKYKKRAGVGNDIESMTGRIIELVDSWKISNQNTLI